MKQCFECGGEAHNDHHVVPKIRGGTKTVPLCTACHYKAHAINVEVLASEGRSKAIAAGVKMGRPIQFDRDKILRLRRKGFSYGLIAKIMKCSRAAVQNAIRRSKSSGLIILALLFTLSCLADVISIRAQGEATATTTPAQLVSFNQRRKYLLVQNKGSRTVYLKFEAAPSGTEGIEIPPGGNYESTDVPIGAAFIKTNAGTSAVFYLEGQ